MTGVGGRGGVKLGSGQAAAGRRVGRGGVAMQAVKNSSKIGSNRCRMICLDKLIARHTHQVVGSREWPQRGIRHMFVNTDSLVLWKSRLLDKKVIPL